MEHTMHDPISDALRQILSDLCTPAVVRRVEQGDAGAALWQAIEEAGLANALLPESEGGAGLALEEAFALFELCGLYAMPLPLAETMVARALLSQAGAQPPAGSITLATARSTAEGVRCDNVAYGAVAAHVLLAIPGDDGPGGQDATVRLLPAHSARKSPAVFPLDAGLVWAHADVAQAPALRVLDLRALQACVMAAQLAGALASVFSRTLQYANDRTQFGRSIGKFQAIQHQLSVMSEHVFAARIAAQIGCRGDVASLSRDGVAVAKARTGEAVVEVAALAHSIHGAIGFTEEFDLQLYTRRLHVWRQAAGSEAYWHDALGARLLARDDRTIEMIRAITDIH